jgi:PAS domain S-box-containing protein
MLSLPMQYTLFVILAPLAAITSIVAVVYIGRHRAAPGALALMWAMIAITIWLILNTLELTDPTEQGTLFWAKLEYPFFTLAPVAWLVFAIQYTGRGKWLTPGRIALLCLVPLIVSSFALTNDWHHLVWKSYTFTPINNWLAMRIVSYGPWFWVFGAYSYSAVLAGASLIVREHFQSWKLYRQQSVWLVVGVLVPIIFSIVYVFRPIPGFRMDYSSIGYAMSGLALCIAILRYQLFELMPIAHKTLVDEMRDGVLVVDRLGRVVDMNPAAQSILSLSASGVIGQPVTQVLGFGQSLADSLSNKAETQTEISVERGEARHYYDLRVSPLKSSRGQLTGRLIVLHDITARREMEEALRRANQELQARNEELDAFDHTVAHDLRSPLTIIIGYANTIADYVDTLSREELQQSARALLKIGLKMDNIIDELMLLAGLRKSQATMGPLDMAGIVAEAQQRLGRTIDLYHVEIVLPAAWPEAIGYSPWVEGVWANYISNAIKYGGRPPRVELGATSQPDGTVRFWVRDNGLGLTPEAQACLFTPFERLDQVHIGGHGLGLSIVRRVVEKMGGQVSVESDGVPGQGCTFSFTLPVAQSEK